MAHLLRESDEGVTTLIVSRGESAAERSRMTKQLERDSN